MLIIRTWQDLGKRELHDLFVLRQRVFIVEQHCPYLDADGLDIHALHILLQDTPEPLIAYARVIPPDLVYNGKVAIGRVVVDPDHRNRGLGRRIMIASLDASAELFPGIPVKISAQSYLKEFYKSLGFTPMGDEYLEDGIPHMAMILENHRAGSLE